MFKNQCTYCHIDEYDLIARNDFGTAFPDSTPLSLGHTVIVPHRHISSFFDMTEKEKKHLMYLVELSRHELELRYKPSGYHISFNDGQVFQTESEPHMHIHVIPKYDGQSLTLDARWGTTSPHH